MTASDRYWRDLFAVTVAAFLAGEVHAFATRNADGTLSAWSHRHVRRHIAARAAWWLAMGWLAVHVDSGRLGVPWRWEAR